MAFKTFVDAVALPASDLNMYLMKQSVIVCTSGTRPSSPNEGMPIYETDTDKLLIYTTATTLWRAPWNMPWGRMGGASTTTAQTGIGSTVTDLTSLTVTFTAVANRRLLITGGILLAQQTSTGFVGSLYITDGGNTILASARTSIQAANDEDFVAPWVEQSPASGSITYKLRGQCSAAGVIQTIGGTGNANSILVEDLGPNGSPA